VGQDLREHVELLQSGDEALFATVPEHYNPIVTTLVGMQKPVIAAVNGVCAGGGLHFVADADIVVAAAGAALGVSAGDQAMTPRAPSSTAPRA